MNAVRARPRRPLRYELYSLAAVLAVPVAVALAFPHEAIGFRPAPDAAPAAGLCAFVSLTEEESARAVANARTAWKVGAENVRRLHADLSVSAMPEEPHGAVMRESERARVPPPRPVAYDEMPLPATLSAPPPGRIAREEPDPDAGLTFSRKELLKLN